MSETRKLYYEDVYIKEFTAKVLECREAGKGYEIVLDQTAFYPEGGGQPCDLGTLNEIAVTDVQEKDGEIVHHTEVALEVGSEVTGKIDWERRFDLMQQHSGEHIVSGLVHEAYGYDNVGFHMSSDVITVDLSGVLTEAQLAEIEAKTNPENLGKYSGRDLLSTERRTGETFLPKQKRTDRTGASRAFPWFRPLCMLWNTRYPHRRDRCG